MRKKDLETTRAGGAEKQLAHPSGVGQYELGQLLGGVIYILNTSINSRGSRST